MIQKLFETILVYVDDKLWSTAYLSMSATNWLLGTKFLWRMEPTFRVLDRNVFLNLSKIIGSKLAFIVEAQHEDENILMRDLRRNKISYMKWNKINIHVNFIELIM